MHAGEMIAQLLVNHLGTTLTLVALGLTVKTANYLAKKWPIPPKDAKWYVRAAHFVLVNWPTYANELEGEVKSVVPGRPVPFLSYTSRTKADAVDKAREMLGEPKPAEEPKGRSSGDVGVIDIGLMMCIFAVGAVLVFFLAGCDGFKAPAYETLTGIVNATTEARGLLPEACEKAERSAVDQIAARGGTKGEANAAAAAIHGRCEDAQQLMDTTVRSAKTSRDGIYDISSALKDPKAFLGWAKAAVDLYKNTNTILKEFNIALPKIEGVN